MKLFCSFFPRCSACIYATVSVDSISVVPVETHTISEVSGKSRVILEVLWHAVLCRPNCSWTKRFTNQPTGDRRTLTAWKPWNRIRKSQFGGMFVRSHRRRSHSQCLTDGVDLQTTSTHHTNTNKC
jgi:hypothetical protein